MYSKFGQFIDGQWVKSSTDETYEVINPANEETLGNASKASPKDVERALKSAQKGLDLSKEDLIEIELILNKLNNVDRTRVLLMPQGKTIRELNEKGVWVAAACKAQGFRFCPRIHIKLNGDTRGT